MPKSNLPSYAIVELLMRLSNQYKKIGNYKDHTEREADVLVKTSGGNITFSKILIMQQFNDSDKVGISDLVIAASSFRALRAS